MHISQVMKNWSFIPIFGLLIGLSSCRSVQNTADSKDISSRDGTLKMVCIDDGEVCELRGATNKITWDESSWVNPEVRKIKIGDKTYNVKPALGLNPTSEQGTERRSERTCVEFPRDGYEDWVKCYRLIYVMSKGGKELRLDVLYGQYKKNYKVHNYLAVYNPHKAPQPGTDPDLKLLTMSESNWEQKYRSK